MRTEAGFTLIEILAGGVISTVLAGAMLSMFYLVTGNIKENTANSRLLRIRTVAEDQLRRSVRRAYGAKTALTEVGDIITLAKNDANTYTGLKEIWLYEADPGEALIGAYKVSGDTLLELVNGALTPMHIASDTVWIDGANSTFSIFPNRAGVAFDMRYKIHENGNTYADSSLPDSVQCRGKI